MYNVKESSQEASTSQSLSVGNDDSCALKEEICVELVEHTELRSAPSTAEIPKQQSCQENMLVCFEI